MDGTSDPSILQEKFVEDIIGDECTWSALQVIDAHIWSRRIHAARKLMDSITPITDKLPMSVATNCLMIRLALSNLQECFLEHTTRECCKDVLCHIKLHTNDIPARARHVIHCCAPKHQTVVKTMEAMMKVLHMSLEPVPYSGIPEETAHVWCEERRWHREKLINVACTEILDDWVGSVKVKTDHLRAGFDYLSQFVGQYPPQPLIEYRWLPPPEPKAT